jgi:L-iditol 2-dehydrogenase
MRPEFIQDKEHRKNNGEKYKGLIYYGAQNFVVEELDMYECGDDDAILKCEVASVCGSDTDTWLNGGKMHYLPDECEFGHEVYCTVYAVGKNVKDVKIGDRVAPFPGKATPNSRRSGWLGGFSEYIYVTNASYETNLFHIPDNVTDVEAALIEPMSVGLRGADIVPVNENSVALILGAGFIGYSCAIGLADKGVPRDHITLVDRCENRLEICRAEGFNAVSTADPDWQQEVCKYTGTAATVYGPGSAADVIIDCAGSINPNGTGPTLMDIGIKMLKFRGKFVCVGVHRRQPQVNFQKLVFGMIDILCGSGNSKPYFEWALRVLDSGRFNVERAVTQKFPFEQIKEGIVSTCNANECMKVVIDYRK